MSNSNESGGTTILRDGTKIHWSEGRGGYSVVIYPDGKKEEVNDNSNHPIIKAVINLDEIGADEYRQMTPQEEAEWKAARYGS